MKNELRATALNAVTPIITNCFNEGAVIPVTINKKDMLAVNTGIVDEDGLPVYATIDITIKDNAATQNHEGFSLEAAIAAYNEKQSKASERKSKVKATSAPKNTEAAEKRNKRMAALREWWMDGAEDGVAYTSTEVKTTLPDLYGDLTIMQVGSDLKMLSEMLPTNCELTVEKGKKMYVKHD